MDRLPDSETYRANALDKGYDEVLERSCAPGTVTGTQSLAFEVAAVLAQGEMWLEQGPISAPMVPGSRFQLKPNVPRSERYGPEGALFFFACRHAKEKSA